MRKSSRFKTWISVLLCIVFCASTVLITSGATTVTDSGTVTITVNYVYDSNQAMVAQPWSAQITKGDAFSKTVAVPKQPNYTIPVDKAVGLNSDITYSEDTEKNGSLNFNLSAVTEDITVTLYYVAGTTNYTVNHYYQNLENDNYAEPISVSVEGAIDAYTAAVAENTTGFICKGVPKYTIASDGTTVVDIYYDRVYYTVIFDVNGGINGPEPVYAKYGTTFDSTLITTPTRQGYTFDGWYPDSEGSEKLSGMSEVTQNITYVAHWTPISQNANYTIVLWGQNANDDEYSYLSSNSAYGVPGSSVSWNEKTLICKAVHEHTQKCYMGSLKPDTSLWTYFRSDTVTIDANGSTVLNVYFTRNEFTINFKDGRSAIYSIKERWGTDIKSHWPIKGTNGTTYNKGERWQPSGSSIYQLVLVYIAVMPAENFTLTVNRAYYAAYNMHYMVEALPGSQGTTSYNGKYFTEAFNVSAKYNYVTEAEDFFALEGFTQWKSDPSFNDQEIDIYGGGNVYFYYTRNTYNLEFYSGNNSTPDKQETPLYQANLGQYNYEPKTKPANLEDDAVFVGWYQNPQCTGEEFELSAHTMPANNVALYAKWQNRSYTVKTYTDSDLKELYTYVDYTGSQEVVKYTLATAPTNPTPPEGKAFVGWFYTENGIEKPFSFAMPIVKDYNLYPKYSDQVMLKYVVHYYKTGTTDKVAADSENTVLIGTNVTEKAKMGTDLSVQNPQTYYPDVTSTSVRIVEANQEIIFYYTVAKGVPYTVKYVDSLTNQPIAADKVVSADENPFSVVTESYLAVDGYNPEKYQITQELTFTTDASDNVITFYYDKVNVQINYQVVGPDGCGTVSPSNEEVWVLGNATGSTATASENFRFVGWYSDAECNQVISGDNTFIPKKPEGKWVSTTYYAKFEYNLTELTIQKQGWNSLDVNQTFLFRVTGDNVDLTVAVQGNGKTTIVGLTVGKEYTVTEITDWSWRYDVTNLKQCKIKLSTDKTSNIITVTNSRTNNQWLSGSDAAVNVFGNGGAQ